MSKYLVLVNDEKRLPDNFEEEEVEGGLGNPKDDEIIGNSDLGLEIVE